MISSNPPQCNTCENLIREWGVDFRCKAFPDGVPEELYTSCFDHTEPYPGDNGIQYKKYTGKLDLDGGVETHNFGGEGSGNWGHEGRPGEIGGSGEGGGTLRDSVLKRVERELTKELGHPPSKDLLNKKVYENLKEIGATKQDTPKQDTPKEDTPKEDTPKEASKPTLSDIENRDLKPEIESMLKAGIDKIKETNKYDTLDKEGKDKVDTFLKDNKTLMEKAVKEVVQQKQDLRVKYARSVSDAVKERAALIEKSKTVKLGWRETAKINSLAAKIAAGYEAEDWMLNMLGT